MTAGGLDPEPVRRRIDQVRFDALGSACHLLGVGLARGRLSWGAAWVAGMHDRFTRFDPTGLGSLEYNILEMQALPDGRLLLGFPGSGLLVWRPGDPAGHRLTVRDGLPFSGASSCSALSPPIRSRRRWC